MRLRSACAAPRARRGRSTRRPRRRDRVRRRPRRAARTPLPRRDPAPRAPHRARRAAARRPVARAAALRARAIVSPSAAMLGGARATARRQPAATALRRRSRSAARSARGTPSHSTSSSANASAASGATRVAGTRRSTVAAGPRAASRRSAPSSAASSTSPQRSPANDGAVGRGRERGEASGVAARDDGAAPRILQRRGAVGNCSHRHPLPSATPTTRAPARCAALAPSSSARIGILAVGEREQHARPLAGGFERGRPQRRRPRRGPSRSAGISSLSSDASISSSAVEVRREWRQQHAAAGEGGERRAIVGTELREHATRQCARAVESRRRHVGGVHAARHVEQQHDVHARARDAHAAHPGVRSEQARAPAAASAATSVRSRSSCARGTQCGEPSNRLARRRAAANEATTTAAIATSAPATGSIHSGCARCGGVTGSALRRRARSLPRSPPAAPRPRGTARGASYGAGAAASGAARAPARRSRRTPHSRSALLCAAKNCPPVAAAIAASVSRSRSWRSKRRPRPPAPSARSIATSPVAADADGVYAHAARPGESGRDVGRNRSGVAAAIGEQHDEPARHRRDRCRVSALGLGALHRERERIADRGGAACHARV